jgi:Fe-S-cluster containining protein
VRDGLLLRVVKAVALAGFRVDLGVHRLRQRLRREHVYKLGGDCRRCARCCEAPALQVGPWIARLRPARRAFLWWQARVNGWQLTNEDKGQYVFTFRCSHFDPATRLCDSYDSRPGPCRDYPRLILEQARPEMLPGCGYRPISPRAIPLRRELEARGLPPETLARLVKDLHLE